MHTQDRKTQESLTPADALRILKEGNERFRANLRANRNLLQQVNETRDGQWPFAVILGCVDSRTSAELIFDQGLGDIFSVRIAGNFVNDDILGSMEFACALAGARLVVVLGHTQCGAIKGACDGVELGCLSQMLHKIQPSLAAVPEPRDPSERSSANPDFVEAVARANVQRSVGLVAEGSEVLRALRDSGAIAVIGAIYDVATGGVEFLEGPGAEVARGADDERAAVGPSSERGTGA